MSADKNADKKVQRILTTIGIFHLAANRYTAAAVVAACQANRPLACASGPGLSGGNHEIYLSQAQVVALV